jgi:hypothetical protein
MKPDLSDSELCAVSHNFGRNLRVGCDHHRLDRLRHGPQIGVANGSFYLCRVRVDREDLVTGIPKRYMRFAGWFESRETPATAMCFLLKNLATCSGRFDIREPPVTSCYKLRRLMSSQTVMSVTVLRHGSHCASARPSNRGHLLASGAARCLRLCGPLWSYLTYRFPVVE